MGAALLLLCTWLTHGEAQAPAKAVKWEYKVLDFANSFKDDSQDQKRSKLEADLNKIGNEGWECFGTAGPFYFKRHR